MSVRPQAVEMWSDVMRSGFITPKFQQTIVIEQCWWICDLEHKVRERHMSRDSVRRALHKVLLKTIGQAALAVEIYFRELLRIRLASEADAGPWQASNSSRYQ